MERKLFFNQKNSIMQEKVKEYFQNNPEEDKVFSTADGFLFKQEMYATAHAATITDKEVTKHTRERGGTTAVIPAVEVPVTTETEKGSEIRTKNETVEAPTVMDAPSEVEGKAEVIADVVTEQAEAVKEVAEAAPKAATAAKAKTTANK